MILMVMLQWSILILQFLAGNGESIAPASLPSGRKMESWEPIMRFWNALLIFCISIGSFVSAQDDSASELRVFSYRDFSGGLNDSMSPVYLNPNESPHIENFLIDEIGNALVTRKGYVLCGTMPSGLVPTGIWNYTTEAGTSTLILSDSQNFYSTSNCSTFVTLRTGQDATLVPDCEMVYNEMWCSNGNNDAWRTIVSSTVVMNGASSPDVPTCKYLEFEKNRVWCANVPGSRSSVFFSNLINTTNGTIITPSSSTAWPAVNELRVSPDDGESIHGIKKYRGTVVLCKENSIHILVGNDEFDFKFNRVISNVGCVNNSMVEIDGLLYLVGKQGVYSFNGSNVIKLSDQLDNFWDSVQIPISNRLTKEWTSQSDFSTVGISSSNVDLDNPSGDIRITEKVLFDNFTDGDFSSSPVWTDTPSSVWDASANYLDAGGDRKSTRLNSSHSQISY